MPRRYNLKPWSHHYRTPTREADKHDGRTESVIRTIEQREEIEDRREHGGYACPLALAADGEAVQITWAHNDHGRSWLAGGWGAR